ncbi:MAG: phosphoglycerate kinase [Nitrospinota bacterium]
MSQPPSWNTLDGLNAGGKRVFVRCDFNVPLSREGGGPRITDDTRVRAVLPTLERLRSSGARVILASHLGRPKGKPDPALGLAPVARRLGELLGADVPLAPDCIGEEAASLAEGLRPAGFLMLENLRFHAGEEKDEEGFARELASLADAYVNDAFGCSHRAHASVVAIVDHLRPAVAGLLLDRELRILGRLMEAPDRPVVAILGGAKVSDKLGVIESLLRRVDRILIGGAMAFTFLKAQGKEVGKSRVEHEMIETALRLLRAAEGGGCEILLPVDCVAAEKFAPDADHRTIALEENPENWDDWMGLDVGPKTVSRFADALADAKTIVWNGPLGVFEMDAFSRGTYEMLDRVVSSGATTLIGGGDTDLAVHRAGAAEKVSFISTGGGAFLELLEGKELPGVAALKKAAQRG